MTVRSDRGFWVFNALLSSVAVGFLAWLLLVRTGTTPAADLSFMPAVNASLNATAATLLLLGFWAIRTRQKQLHMRFMVAAFVASAVFLIGYVIYHYTHGDTQYTGVGTMRIIYFAVLISHVVLSIVMLPMILTTFYFASQERFVSHKRLARWTLPIWLYVSVTGVLIYWMLY